MGNAHVIFQLANRSNRAFCGFSCSQMICLFAENSGNFRKLRYIADHVELHNLRQKYGVYHTMRNFEMRAKRQGQSMRQ